MAKSRSIGSIYAELTLKDQMSKGLAKAQTSLSKFAATSAKWAGAGLAAGVTTTSAALIAGAKHTLSMTDELADMSAQTGIAISDMMLLQQAYKDGGREAEAVGKDIGKMQKALVTASQGGSDPFASIGLSVADLMAMNPAKQFETIGAAIMRIQNPAERTAKAMEIFGKGGMGLTTVFGGVENAARALGRMPELAERFGAAMGEANDLLGHMPLKSDQFFMGFTAGIIGQVLPALDEIDNYDFTTLGESIGKAIGIGFEGLTSGKIAEIGALKFEAAFARVYGELANMAIEHAKASAMNMPVPLAARSLMKGEFDWKGPTDVIDAAQKRANPYADLIEYMSDTSDDMLKDLEKKYKASTDRAAKLGSFSPIKDPITSTAPAAQAAEWTPPAPAMLSGPGYGFVDEYMKRGLSVSAMPATSQQETKLQTVVDVLRDISAGLGRMEDKYAPGTW